MPLDAGLDLMPPRLKSVGFWIVPLQNIIRPEYWLGTNLLLCT